jgi:response regulator of citrate/malate metabolism
MIVFSLDPSLETVERAFHAGANDYLITPFDPTVMEEKIEQILDQRPSLVGNRQEKRA